MIGMVVVAEKQIDCFGGQGLVIDRYIPAGVGFNNAILGAIGLATVHVEDCPSDVCGVESGHVLLQRGVDVGRLLVSVIDNLIKCEAAVGGGLGWKVEACVCKER